MFADDTCLVYVDSDLKRLEDHANKRLQTIYEWCKYNRMSLNPSKSEYLIITNKKIDYDPDIKINGETVHRKSSIKYLGMFIDERLKFTDHIDNLKTKLSRLTGVTYRLKHMLNLKTAKIFYYSCVYSVLTYCICAWGGTLKNGHRGDSIIKLQTRIVKNIFARHFTDNSCIYSKVGILKLVDIYKFYCSIRMFKRIRETTPVVSSTIIPIRYPTHEHRTRGRHNLITPFPRVDAIKYNFQYQFIIIWNEVPESIKESNSVKIFKRRLMSHITNTY